MPSSLTADARTTVVRVADTTLPPAIRLALAFAAVKLLLHVGLNLWQAHIGWGYFRDEFYYIACGRKLAWGYVDHGPIVAVQARLAETLFGHSLVGLRLLSAAAGAARVLLTGLLAWSLGGRRPAQALAMTACLVVPQYFGIDGFLSMNSFESLFWMACLLALIVAQRRLDGLQNRILWTGPLTRPGERETPPRVASQESRPSPGSATQALRAPWLFFGLFAGLGLLNKPSMTFFLLALAAALLLTPARRLLLNRYAALGIALLILIASPNLLWQIHNHWPTLEFLQNGRAEGKNTALAPPAFLLAQLNALHPLNVLVLIPGLYALLAGSLAKRWRWLGLTFVLFLLGMMALHAKDYYVTPIYPILFAAGGVAWERRFSSRSSVQQNRAFAFPIFETALVLTGALILPLGIPVLRPNTWLRYTIATHLYNEAEKSETASSGPLPEFYADRFGWNEYLALVERAYVSLSPADRARVTLYAENYGEAGALDFFSREQHLGLPPAISGQNNYWLWGTHGGDPNLVIAITSATPEELRKQFTSVTVVGRMSHPLAMPFEHKNVYLLRGRRPGNPFVWSKRKHYI